MICVEKVRLKLLKVLVIVFNAATENTPTMIIQFVSVVRVGTHLKDPILEQVLQQVFQQLFQQIPISPEAALPGSVTPAAPQAYTLS